MFSKTLSRPFCTVCNLALFQFFQFFVGKHRAAGSNQIGRSEVQKSSRIPMFKTKSRKMEAEIGTFNDIIETSVKKRMDRGL